MIKIQNSKKYDLEERTLEFARKVIKYINSIPKSLPNLEISKQVIRSSASVGANYIEANEALSKKDFIMRIKISRKEAKETCYWLKLIEANSDLSKEQAMLLNESTELMKIFGSILEKSIQKYG